MCYLSCSNFLLSFKGWQRGVVNIPKHESICESFDYDENYVSYSKYTNYASISDNVKYGKYIIILCNDATFYYEAQ